MQLPHPECEFTCVTEEVVRALIVSAKDSSPPTDPSPGFLFKAAADGINWSETCLINQCFEAGEYPTH